MDIEILYSCKENIQPLKKGRKANQLGLALQAEVNTELQDKLSKERGEYELAIITYDGPDPLQPRIEYVAWLEQTHIKHGRDCNLIPLLEDTITLLKDNEKYKQDPRFIELIVKYIETQENAVELFQMVYSQGLGTMCAVLYKAWAEALDQALDFKRADQVYQLGIANHAEPIEILKEGHEQFQLSVVRRKMISGDLTQTSNEEESQSRLVLGKLKKDVGSIRRAHGAPGVLTIKQNKQSSSKQVPIFQDLENNYDHLITAAIQKNKLASIATSEKNKEENTVKASTWNKAYNRREVSRLPSVPSTPSFKVHVDPDAEDRSDTSKTVAKTPSNVLKTRKAEFASNAMDVLGSGHSARKALQANLELYSGGREFSFEELRAAYYKRKTTKNEMFKTPLKNSHGLLPSQESYDDCQTPLCAFSNLSLCSAVDGTNEINDKKSLHSPLSKNLNNDFASCETPLKHLGFMPLTPSIKVGDLKEFIETPDVSSENIISKKNSLSFSVFSDDCSSAEKSHTTYPVAKSEVLPTIEENQEMENDSPLSRLSKKPVVFPIRKKQLFSENSENKISAKPKSNFSIFVDDE